MLGPMAYQIDPDNKQASYVLASSQMLRVLRHADQRVKHWSNKKGSMIPEAKHGNAMNLSGISTVLELASNALP